jgi:hypothetical protein
MRMERPLSLISLEQEQAALLHCLFHLMWDLWRDANLHNMAFAFFYILI